MVRFAGLPVTCSPLVMRATELFAEGLTVREVAATLYISKSGSRAIADSRIDGWNSGDG
jgi:hypothetical protein